MDDDEKRMLFNEINILREIDHPNIVKMYEFFEDAIDTTLLQRFAREVNCLTRSFNVENSQRKMPLF